MPADASADADRVWTWFMACCLASASAGMAYSFSAFSSALKAEWSLSQSELESIAVAGNLAAGLLGGVAGGIADAAVPAHSMAGGGLVAALSYATFWAIATRQLPIGPVPPVAALGACIAASAMGATLVMTTVVALLVRTLSRERGLLIGLMKAYVGTAAGGLAVMYQGTGRALGGPEPAALGFVLAIAAEILLVTALPACLLPRRPMSQLRAAPEREDSARARALLARRTAIVCGCLAGLLCALAAGALLPNAHRPAALAFLLCWLAPALLTRRGALACASAALAPLPAGLARLGYAHVDGGGSPAPAGRRRGRASSPLHVPLSAGNETAALLGGAAGEPPAGAPELRALDSCAALPPCAAPPPDGAILPSATVVEMACTAECWLLVYIVAVLFGGGMMVTTNLAQLLSARGQPALIGTCLSLFSIGSALGRALGGLLSDWARGALELPASACLAADAALMIAAHAALASHGATPVLLAGVTLAGAAFGAAWPHVVLVAAECFGKAHLGANYGFYDGLCQAAGSLLLAKVLPGRVYARNAAAAGAAALVLRGDGVGIELECVGPDCFGDAHRAIIGLCALALAATAWLVRMQTVRMALAGELHRLAPPR